MADAKECIDILISLEPVFKKAGELALELRATTKSKNKFNTGIAGIDIVTEADHAVQEMILTEMAKTKLIECELIAEEDSGPLEKFSGTNGLVLSLDPIDGTIIYASTGRFFSTMVTLHNKKDILYTFYNYPAVSWSRRITGGKIDDFVVFPKIKIKEGLNLEKTIAYTSSKDPKAIDPAVYKKIIARGYEFRKLPEITNEAGSFALFFSGAVAGYYTETPNPYDGLVALHYGQTKKYEIYSELDISKCEIIKHGPHYKGWYVVINK